jgi:hypothetical protein
MLSTLSLSIDFRAIQLMLNYDVLFAVTKSKPQGKNYVIDTLIKMSSYPFTDG